MILIPRKEKFYDLFEKNGSNIVRASELFVDLTARLEDKETIIHQIRELEHQGDLITHETVEKIHRTFVTPFDREDMYALVTGLDNILDFIEDAAQGVRLYKIEKMTEPIKSLALVLLSSAKMVRQALGQLHNMKGKEEILTSCIEINRLENEGDTIQREALADLFAHEKDPLEVIKWKEVYGDVESAIDQCEEVAVIIEGIVLKNA